VTLRIGIIGAGVVAAKHANAYRQNPHCQIVAVSEVLPDKGQAFAQSYGAEFYEDYHELLTRAAVDAVSICLPHHLHHQAALAAAKARAHILLEKPISITLQEADEIIEICARCGVKLMIGFVHRFHGEILEAKRLIHDGHIGQPATALDSICTLGGQHPPAWIWRREFAGGGVLMYGGIHSVDRLRWLIGSEVIEVYARKLTYCNEADVEDGLTAVLQFKSGAIASLFENSPSYGKPGGWITEIYGNLGAIRIKTGECLEYTSTGLQYTQTFQTYDHFQREIDEFVSAIRENREPWIRGEDGREALAIAQAIYESAETGRPVRPTS